MERFYYGLTGGGTDRRIGGGYLPYGMISAATLWNPKTTKFRNYRPPRMEHLGLDCGGFTFQKAHGEYPFGLEEYVALAKKLAAGFVATLDHPCEPGVDRTIHATNEERVELTAKNAGRAMREAAGIPWVPVIQGFVPAEYAHCIELLEAEHAVTDYMAIGSLCTRTTRSRTWEVLRVIQKMLPNTKLHGFGVSLTILRDKRIARALYSADSQAWRFFTHFDASIGRTIWKPRTIMAQVNNYPRYARKVALVMTGHPSAPLERFA